MTLRTFARRTGWPLDELVAYANHRPDDFDALLELYGLTYSQVIVSVNRRTRTITFAPRIVDLAPVQIVLTYADGIWSPGIPGSAP